MKSSYVVAVVIVVLILAGVGFAVTQMNQTAPLVSSSQTSVSQTSQQSSQSSTQQITSVSSTSAGSQRGNFAMLVSDPPMSASGVSKVYMKYRGEEAHRAQSDRSSGWTNLNVTGTVELTSSVNTTQTIASAKISSGAYDMVRLDGTSFTVLYNGHNYTASVSSAQLSARMRAQAQVNGSVNSAAVIDIRTIIMNAGNETNPQFTASASAKATVVPYTEVTSATLSVGARSDVHASAWWNQFVAQTTAKLQITSATLTSNSLNINIKNSGSDNTTIHLITITPISASGSVGAVLPATLSSSSVITVEQNSTAQASGQISAQTLFGGTGLNLDASSSAAVAYKGTIQLGSGGLLGLVAIAQGQQYVISCVSDDSAVSMVVVAG